MVLFQSFTQNGHWQQNFLQLQTILPAFCRRTRFLCHKSLTGKFTGQLDLLPHDGTPNKQVTLLDQSHQINSNHTLSTLSIRLDGQLYDASIGSSIELMDRATGDTYQFAQINVDLDGDGLLIAGNNEHGHIWAQISGASLQPDDYLKLSNMMHSEFSSFESLHDVHYSNVMPSSLTKSFRS